METAILIVASASLLVSIGTLLVARTIIKEGTEQHDRIEAKVDEIKTKLKI